MSFNKEQPRVAIIGSGLGGLSTAIALKKQLGFDNFLIYEKESDIGGTWRDNIYPGCSSDVAGHWYCLSSEPNPYWSSYYVEQPEILAYWERVVAKHRLRDYVVLNTAVVSSTWDDAAQVYRLVLRDTKTGAEREEVAEAVISAAGGFTEPRYPDDIPGIGDFKGPKFHSARWRKDVDLHGKTVGVIGNAASGVQLIPRIAQDQSTKVINFCRTPNWFAFTPNYPYPSIVKWAFAHVPGLMWAYRTLLFLRYDMVYLIFRNENKRLQALTRKLLTQELKRRAPKEMHDKLIPDYRKSRIISPGCRRIIVEPGYLKSLRQPNVSVNWDGIAKLDEDGIVTKKGEKVPLDVVVFATGFYVVKMLTEVQGKHGLSLQDYFAAQGGATAYLGTTVPGFPNFFLILGPNIATGHASVIFSEEVQINYIVQLLKPVLERKASSFSVRADVTDKFNDWIQSRLNSSVFAACHSYYRAGGSGKNVAIWPGSVALYWWKARKVNWSDYEAHGAQKWENEQKRKKRVRVLLFLLLALAVTASTHPDIRSTALTVLAPYLTKVYELVSKLPFVSDLAARLK
ncbi:hypothetical protein ACEPAH_4336 [Sanghuangporus vaninii]